MSSIDIKSSAFPSWEESVRAKWAPVFLQPIVGSSERLVIGVIVVAKSDFHLEMANAWERLECLYGDSSELVIFSAKNALVSLQDEMFTHAEDSLSSVQSDFSNVMIGQALETEGPSIEEIGRSWMRAISSLYNAPNSLQQSNESAAKIAISTREMGERLPRLVYDNIIERRPGLGDFFRDDIRKGTRRSSTGSGAQILIDFAGSKLVANFGTLRANRPTASANMIKKQLWDLKVQRDKEAGSFGGRAHEMIVQHQNKNDPQVTSDQYDNIRSSLAMLEEQADSELVRLRPMNTVDQITKHVVRLEAA